MPSPTQTAEEDRLAKLIWDYMLMHHKLKKADAILVPCTHYLPLADYAAELFHKGYAPIIVFSGDAPVLTKHDFATTEAEAFAERAKRCGVPEAHILLEPTAQNTEQNFVFSRELLQERHIPVNRVIVVQKPYMERRCWATIQKHWPQVEAIITSPPISYENFIRQNDRHRILSAMVGDVERIKVYPGRGFQIPQPMPDDIWEAKLQLEKLGYKPRNSHHKDELQRIPGVGPRMSADFRELGIHAIHDLKNKNPRQLYERLCNISGTRLDPCVLYAIRCAVYFASSTTHQPEKLKWWYWKGHTYNEE